MSILKFAIPHSLMAVLENVFTTLLIEKSWGRALPDWTKYVPGGSFPTGRWRVRLSKDDTEISDVCFVAS